MWDSIPSSSNMLYHGTWFLAHEHTWSVYDGKPTGRIKRVVEDIMTNGLIPFHDPLNPDGSVTISLTRDPLYALMYSLCYAEKWTSKVYFPQREKTWAKILLWITISIIKNRLKWIPKESLTPTVFQAHNTIDKAWRWSHTFNNRDYNSPIHAFASMIIGESNIVGNYPVVLEIKDDGSFEAVPGWSEIRTKNSIHPSQISGIYVPEKHQGNYSSADISIRSLEELVRKVTCK